MLDKDRANIVELKEASVTKILLEFERRAVLKRTVVPAKDKRVSYIETALLATGNTDKNPVLLTARLPFTVVISAEELALKNVWNTVFVSLIGRVVWLRLND